MSRITGHTFVSLCALMLFLSGTPTLRAVESLPKQIESVIDAPKYKHASWGLLVVDAKTGETIYQRNAEKLFVPASVTKLFSTATALCVLGADYRFRTPVYQRGELKDGKLTGDLIVVAQGDLSFGGRNDGNGQMAFRDHDHSYANYSVKAELTDTDPLAGIRDLAKQIHKAGIREIIGGVLIDARLFVPTSSSGSGPSQIYPILVNDNVIDLIITPAEKPGELAKVEMRPNIASVELENKLVTAEKFQPTLTLLQAKTPQKFRLLGQITVGRKPLVRYVPIASPREHARDLLRQELQRLGIKFTHKATKGKDDQAALPEEEEYEKLPKVAEHVSLPLAEATKVILKTSHNLYASTLPLLMAVEKGKTTLAEGLRVQGRFLKNELHLDPDGYSFASGAGGTRADRMSPRAAVQLLQKMSTRSEFEAWVRGFPILGVDGTLADVVDVESSAKGKVQAKTGTLTWLDQANGRTLLESKALAGLMTTKTGRKLYFAIFVNNVPLPKGVSSIREGKALGHLCELIYEGTPALKR